MLFRTLRKENTYNRSPRGKAAGYSDFVGVPYQSCERFNVAFARLMDLCFLLRPDRSRGYGQQSSLPQAVGTRRASCKAGALVLRDECWENKKARWNRRASFSMVDLGYGQQYMRL